MIDLPICVSLIVWDVINFIIFVSSTKTILQQQEDRILTTTDSISWVLILFFLSGPLVWFAFPTYCILTKTK